MGRDCLQSAYDYAIANKVTLLVTICPNCFQALRIKDKYPLVQLPPGFAAKCFPSLQQHGQQQRVQLRFTVDGEDSTPAAGALCDTEPQMLTLFFCN
jgi:hypothetical protein